MQPRWVRFKFHICSSLWTTNAPFPSLSQVTRHCFLTFLTQTMLAIAFLLNPSLWLCPGEVALWWNTRDPPLLCMVRFMLDLVVSWIKCWTFNCVLGGGVIPSYFCCSGWLHHQEWCHPLMRMATISHSSPFMLKMWATDSQVPNLTRLSHVRSGGRNFEIHFPSSQHSDGPDDRANTTRTRGKVKPRHVSHRSNNLHSGDPNPRRSCNRLKLDGKT